MDYFETERISNYNSASLIIIITHLAEYFTLTRLGNQPFDFLGVSVNHSSEPNLWYRQHHALRHLCP